MARLCCPPLLGLLLTALACPAAAQLRLESWPGVSFSPPSAATLSLVPAVNLSSANGFAPPDFSSHRLTGTITSPVDDLLVFTAVADGGVRVWVNDWLAVDGGMNMAPPSSLFPSSLHAWPASERVYGGDGSHGRRVFGPSDRSAAAPAAAAASASSSCPRSVHGFLGIPVQGGVPLPLRVEYTRFSAAEAGCPPSLALLWQGNASSSPSPVPASALEPTVSDVYLERMALRARLEAPSFAAVPARTPWQSYMMRNMLAHARMPDGVAVSATLADLRTGAVLGDVHVFPRFDPATVRPGLKSMNGSDYSRVDVSAWGARDCTVRCETAVAGEGGEQLLFLATPDGGADCASLALLVVVEPMAERAAFPSSSDGGAAIQVDVPGFSSFVVAPAAESPPLLPYPFPTPNNVTAFIALPLGGPAAFAAGGATAARAAAASAVPSLPAIQAAVAAGEQACDGEAAAWVGPGGDLEVAHATSNVFAWNTIFNPFEGVMTPVTRAWDGGSGYTMFDWDTLLGALVMAARSRAGNPVWADVGFSNLLQILLARTVEGFVPNYASGPHISFDRTEPQVGAVLLRRIYELYGPDAAGWLVDAALGPLLSWSQWFWDRRRGEGVFAGPDGHADLISLGSDPNVPCSACIGANTFAGARYESGLDNSAQYEFAGNNSGVGFDNVTSHHMFLYDVGFSALYAADLAALVELCEVAGRYDEVPVLQERLARVTAAIQAHLWNAEDGMFGNVLYDGTPHGRYAPTAFFPLIAPGVATDEQADLMMATLRSPTGFCLNASYAPDPSAAVLFDLWDGQHDNAAGTTDAFLGSVVGARYAFVRAEAAVLNATAPLGDALLPLNLFYSALYDDYALATNSSADGGLGASYTFVRREGACFAGNSSSSSSSWATTPLTLWYNAARHDYQVCGSPQCLSDVSVLNYAFVSTLCTAWNATGPTNLPCAGGPVPLPSIMRADPTFLDNTYWRGRAWGPHYLLTYLGLEAYDHVPSVREARLALVAAGRAVSVRNWATFGHVAENGNGILGGVPEDVSNADPFYTWGADFGFIGLMEAGLA